MYVDSSSSVLILCCGMMSHTLGSTVVLVKKIQCSFKQVLKLSWSSWRVFPSQSLSEVGQFAEGPLSSLL